jgi:prephenate dehydratase
MAKQLTIGIQGGVGSFNEQALKMYLERQGYQPCDVEIKYLYTTDNVLSELKARGVERGQFATENSLGGPVRETLAARAKYSFEQNYEVLDRYSIPIALCLMIHPDARTEEVDTIMTHPHVLAQCRATLALRYPGVALEEGAGDLIDPAKVGEAIARGLLPRNVATVSNRLIAEARGLKIVGRNLQDREDNFTTFVFVKARD